MSDRTFLDTNIVVYVFDDDSPERQARAAKILRADGEKSELVLSTQVLQEFYVAVTRKLERPLAEADALAAVRGLTQLTVTQVDPDMILSAIELSQTETISFWDALIVQAALSAGCRTLLTEDMQEGRRFGELRVENPFAIA
jgi:predicted nucleic acid-binding protein